MKKRLSIVLLLICLPQFVFCQSYGKFIDDSIAKIRAYDSLIVWYKNRKLTINDFQGNPDTTVIAIAESYCDFLIIYNFDTPFKAHAISFFNKKIAWVKRERIDSNVIEHEQGHFDIAEITCRKMNIGLKKIKVINDSIFYNISVVYADCINYYNDLQMQYDKETTHLVSIKQQKEKQKEWHRKISSLLK